MATVCRFGSPFGRPGPASVNLFCAIVSFWFLKQFSSRFSFLCNLFYPTQIPRIKPLAGLPSTPTQNKRTISLRSTLPKRTVSLVSSNQPSTQLPMIDRILSATNSVLSVLAYTVLAVPFVALAIATAYGLAKYTLHLL